MKPLDAPAQAARRAALAGCAFSATEAACGLLRPLPLDPAITPADALAGTAGLVVGLALLGGALGRWLGARGAAVAALVWALVWAPEGPRAGEDSLWWAAPAVVAAAAPLLWPRLLLPMAAVGGLWVPSWRSAPADLDAVSSPASGGAPGVLLITVDTVRSDADLLAPLEGRCDTWSEAVSPSPWTLPAMHSLWTGAAVAEHAGGLPTGAGWSKRSAAHGSWASRFREAGFETHALVSNPHLRADQGFSEGFQRFVHHDGARETLTVLHNAFGLAARASGGVARLQSGRDEALARAAHALLASPSASPRLVWVHLLRPHEYRRDAAGDVPGWSPTDASPEALRAAYAGNVAASAELVHGLVDAAEGWVVAVTSDHGEELGEGGRWGHGHRLHDALLRVPLAVCGPHQAGVSHAGQVTTADLLPALWTAVQASKPVSLPVRQRVPVGGLRRVARFGRRVESTGVIEDARPALPVLRAAPLDGRVADRLRALGYLDGP